MKNAMGSEARGGFALFERASRIRVVEAMPEELPESRRANGNSGHGFRGEQYALWLKGGSLGGSVAGENRPAAVHDKTPRKSEEVIVDLGFIAAQFEGQSAAAKAADVAMPYTLQQDIDNTIAHELAHGIGAPHHGKETEWFGKREVTERMVDYHAYDIDGSALPRPFKIDGRIGRPGNDASGDTRCIMCYTNYYTWAVVGPESGPYDFHYVGPQPVGDRFCTSPAGTGYNAPHRLANGKEAPGYFGDARGQGEGEPVGNCLGATQVRDWE